MNLVQALKDNKTPLQLVQMPCVTVELTKLKHDKLHHIHFHQHPSIQRQNSNQSSSGACGAGAGGSSGRERLDSSDVHFKQSFSSRSPLFSCW